MHNNYYFLRHLIPELNQKLQGMALVEAFSQNKNELKLTFAEGSRHLHINAHLTGQFTCIAFPEEVSKATKNIAHLFTELNLAQVDNVYLYQNERAFSILFKNDYRLLFKLFGRQANVVLLKNDKVESLFRKSFKNDLIIDPALLDRKIDQSVIQIEAALPHYHNLFPALGKDLITEIDEKIKNCTRATAAQRIVDAVENIHNNKEFYVVRTEKGVKLTLSKYNDVIGVFTSPMEAVTSFFFTYLRDSNFREIKHKLLTETEKQIGKTEVYLAKVRRKRSSISENFRYGQTADLIMANLHIIPANATEIRVPDFYTDNKMITIKLNPQLSAQANAERLYRKAKNSTREIANLEQTINSKDKLLRELIVRKAAILSASSTKDLRFFIKEPIKSAAPKKTPFKEFNIDGFTVYVGNNAKQNDLLTLKYAHKDDLFFHAKDVSGSHVILKYDSSRNFPSNVLETVAGIAAYYSKRKQDTLCPVGYTPKKYVRKPKGSAPGLVVVEREKVLLVPPHLP